MFEEVQELLNGINNLLNPIYLYISNIGNVFKEALGNLIELADSLQEFVDAFGFLPDVITIAMLVTSAVFGLRLLLGR